MRTTLDLDDDLLNAARELARVEGTSLGRVVSRLARAGLTGRHPASAPASVTGFVPFADTGRVVSNDTVNRLRDAEGV